VTSTGIQQLDKRERTEKLRDGWRIVRFGEVAINVDITEHNPLANGLERYVGLDHIDPESLHIKRWGLIEEGTSFTRKFVKGQVLFGKRRAYQRKVAIADFDGICSGDILVFEAKNDLLPELLPFIVQSDGFYEYALSTSAGSLSPRTTWKDLAAYEFALPPEDEQRRIADILWAVDEANELHQKAINDAKTTLELLIHHLMQHGLNGAAIEIHDNITCPKHWKIKTLQDIAVVDRGRFAHRPRNLPRFYGGQYPFVQTGDVARSDGMLQSYEQTLSEEGKTISRSFGPNSILITIAAIIGETAITPFEVWCPDSLVGIVPHDEVNVNFIEFYLRTVQKFLNERAATQSAQKNINLNVLRPLKIPIPPLEEQNVISTFLLSFQKQIQQQREHLLKIHDLKNAILSRLLETTKTYW
jgi:type I restriction enzyme, S subunit